ncbi:coat protein F [Alicyclobacillus tengchongensis]|nr:coat protein F [Alicyclobacillus tengchongensis]
MQQQQQPNAPYGAHEIIGMHEALSTKSANVEMFSFLSQQAQDMQLRNLLQQQAHMIEQHYVQGVQIMQGSANANNQLAYQPTMHVQPKLGLRNPSHPAPNMNAQSLSDRTICTVALNLHKFGATAWTSFALECVNPQFRAYLMAGANMCDRMAYDIFSFMNQKGDYQVPTLQQNTTQTMIQSYQLPQQPTMQQSQIQ